MVEMSRTGDAEEFSGADTVTPNNVAPFTGCFERNDPIAWLSPAKGMPAAWH
jgi:hypothetical protein